MNWKVIVVSVCFAFVAATATYFIVQRLNEDRIAELSRKLIDSQTTVKVTESLYAVKSLEMKGLISIIEGKNKENQSLLNQLNSTKAAVLTHQKISLRWKNSYESLLESNQVEEPGKIDENGNSGPTRTRVSFNGKLGNFVVQGHTLTNPSQSFIKINQAIPLVLSVTLTKERNGTFTSYVTTSEPEIDINVDVSAVDISVIEPSWKENINILIGAAPVGDIGGSVGILYDLKKISLGTSCQLSENSSSCGIVFGFRPFR